MFFTLVVFVAVLSLLVFVHELGHFSVARKCGLKPEEFGFGFSPRMFAVYKNKEGKWVKVFGNKEITDASDTIYSLNLIPIGGFVKLGEDDEPVDKDEKHFNNLPIYQRAAILVAGVAMNVVLAFVMISFGFMIGLPQVLDEDLKRGVKITDKQIQVVSVLEGSPAEKAGVKTGDVIVEINSRVFQDYTDLQSFVAEGEGKNLNYVFKRGDENVEKIIIPEKLEGTEKAGVGVGIVEVGLVKYPIHLAIWNGFLTTFGLIAAISVAFWDMLGGLFGGRGVGAEVAGPVGIAALTGQVTRMGFVYLLQFAAMLSVNLAIINILPFPALDGGRLMFLIAEKIKGSPVKKEVEGMVHGIGFMLLMVLIVVVTFKDVASYAHVFKALWSKIVG